MNDPYEKDKAEDVAAVNIWHILTTDKTYSFAVLKDVTEPWRKRAFLVMLATGYIRIDWENSLIDKERGEAYYTLMKSLKSLWMLKTNPTYNKTIVKECFSFCGVDLKPEDYGVYLP